MFRGRHNREVRKRVLQQVLSGVSDANIRFDDLRTLLAALGFAERVRGDHHIFNKAEVAEILNTAAWFPGEAVSSQTGSGRHRSI